MAVIFAPARTPIDWLTRDSIEVDKYLEHPLCARFKASIQLAIDILDGLDEIARPRLLADIPQDLPIHVISGMRDPIGAYAKDVDDLLTELNNAGLYGVTHRFYPEARREPFNEINRDEITRDLIGSLKVVIDRYESHLPQPKRQI